MTKNKIVLVPFPFDDFTSVKVRPALCLTSEIGIYEHVIIAFISSKMPSSIVETDIVIKKKSKNWVGTGLRKDSVTRLHKVITIPKRIIKRKLGTINTDMEKQVLKKLNILFNK